ncbi:hypothetical protein ABE530_18610 [Brucella sp. TWI559]
MKEYGVFSRELRTVVLDDDKTTTAWFLVDEKGRDVVPLIQADPSPFYIAVLENGSIFSMWDDIEQLQIPGVQIIGIDNDFGYTWGKGGDVYSKIWNGTAIVEPPINDPVPDEISRRQFFQQLATLELITKDEAKTALQGGAIPAALQALVSQLPDDEQFDAEMLIIGATTFSRLHPLSDKIRILFEWSEEQRDDFWRAAAKL